jgi:hypothetical protein
VVAVSVFWQFFVCQKLKEKKFAQNFQQDTLKNPAFFGKLMKSMGKIGVSKTVKKEKPKYQIRGQKDADLLLISKELSVVH